MKVPSLFVATLCIGPLLAQDSVSKIKNVPGDSIPAYTPGEQINDFVVDLSAFQSSWGNTYGVAPLVKASEPSDAPTFFTHLISAQAISKDVRSNAPFARTGYSLWNAQGSGVHPNPAVNDPGTNVNTTGKVGRQFAVTFSEFGTQPGGISTNNVIGGVVNHETEVPSRLYVSRIVGAVNSPDYTCNLSQFGTGGIDADGNTSFRGDDFAVANGCGFNAITGNNLYRLDLLARAAAVNVIHGAGSTDAGSTVRVVNGSGTVHVTPTIIPESKSVALRPIVIGSDFASNFVYEGVAGSASYTSGHLAAGIAATRGNVSHTYHNFAAIFGGNSRNGTAATLGIDDAHTTNNEVTNLLLWGLKSDGGAASIPRAYVLPAVITDNDTGWPSNSLGAGLLTFAHYYSQIPFRGGNGMVAIGKDQSDRLLAAAVVDHPASTGAQHQTQLIAVVRVDASGTPTWTVAAYNDNSSGVAGTGKPILDGPGGSIVGRLVSLNTSSGGAVPGPSVSSPMFDSVGNLYFLAAVERFLGGGNTQLATGLVRAVYDAAGFSYELELLFHSGSIFLGQNSTTDYRVNFVDIADSNSIGSGTAFSGNIVADAYNGIDPDTLETSDARTLGGLIINAQILYDVDRDGSFDIQTGTGGDPNQDDEDYRVLLFVSAAADCNQNGRPDDLDVELGLGEDLNGNGVLDDCEGNLGTRYCVANPNSTGFPALISAIGSASVAANDLTLRAEKVPNQPFIFFSALNQAQIPFGNGFLCANGAINRILPPGSATGNIALRAVDLPNEGIVPGTLNFQCWYRDPMGGGAAFNTSDGLQITFVP